MLQNGFLYMAMTDYPYPASFLEPMPAWPVNASCEAFADVAPMTNTTLYDTRLGDLSDRETLVLTALKAASDVYFNYTNQTKCTDVSDTDATGNLDGAGWNVLACNELAMPTSMGPDSMFIKADFNYTAYSEDCQTTYGLTPKYTWALDYFGGKNYSVDFLAYSNIIFSNGNLDPWRAGGVDKYVNLDLPVYVIEGGAHHLDLREPNAADNTTNVAYVREQEDMMIGRWVQDYQGPTPQPNMTEPVDDQLTFLQ